MLKFTFAAEASHCFFHKVKERKVGDNVAADCAVVVDR